MSQIPQELYDIVGAFEEDKASISTKGADFSKLVEAMKSTEPTVRAYVSQAVPEVAAYFPDEISVVVSRQIALCEDDDSQVRNAALRGLARLPPAIPVGNTELIAQVASAVIQLLMFTEDGKERVALSHATTCMIKANFIECFKALVSLISSPDFAEMISRLISFAREHFFSSKEDMKNPETKAIVLAQLKALLVRPGVTPSLFQTFFVEISKLDPVTKENAAERVPEYCDILYSFGGIPVDGSEVDASTIDYEKLSLALRLAQRSVYSRSSYAPTFAVMTSITQVLDFFLKTVLPAVVATPEASTTKDMVNSVQTLSSLLEFMPSKTCPSRFLPIYELFKKTVSTDAEHAFDCAPASIEILLFTLHHIGSYALDTVQSCTGLNMGIGQPFSDSLDVVILKKKAFIDVLNALSAFAKKSVQTNSEKIVQLQSNIKALVATITPETKAEEATEATDAEDVDAKKTQRFELNQEIGALKAKNKVLASIITLAALFLAEKPACTRFGRAVLSFNGSANNQNKSLPPKGDKNAKGGAKGTNKGGDNKKSNTNAQKGTQKGGKPEAKKHNNAPSHKDDTRTKRKPETDANRNNSKRPNHKSDERDNRDNRDSRRSRPAQGHGGQREQSRSSSTRRDNSRNRR